MSNVFFSCVERYFCYDTYMRDREIFFLITKEKRRQKNTINLIASENYVSPEVRKAVGSELMHKYAEGYPGKRYYAGNTTVDQVELLAQKRALSLFRLNPKKFGVNVQALSGSPANMAVYHALLKYGDKIMSMDLSHGGHLTHGHHVSVTGRLWKHIPYFVTKETQRLDYEALLAQAKRTKPQMIIAGYTAYPRKISWKKMRIIADSVGALLLVDMSHIAGLVAGKQHPSPFPYADVVMTTTHKTLRGPRGALLFARKDKQLKNGISYFDAIQRTVFPGLQGGPHLHTIAGIAIALSEASQDTFRAYTQQVVQNAKTLARTLKREGWHLTTGGTDTHLILMDVWKNGKGIDGKRASEVLEQEGIIVNMNTLPYDTRTPFRPSGIRLGTAAETTKGKTEEDMVAIGKKISRILKKAIEKK